MTAAKILTMALLALAQVRAPVICNLSPLAHQYRGLTVWPQGKPSPVYVRLSDCRATVQLVAPAVVVFAHEILHVKHPWWPHPRVYALQWAYARIVRRELISLGR